MTATQRTTDRSRSVTTLNSLGELNDIARETQLPAWDVPIQAASALLRSRSPTALKRPPKPRAPTRLPHNRLAAARRLDPPPARRSALLRLSLLLFRFFSVTTSVRHLSHQRSRPHPTLVSSPTAS